MRGYHVSSCEGASSPHRTYRRRESPMHNSPTWNFPNQNGIVPRIFFESRRFNDSHNSRDSVIARTAVFSRPTKQSFVSGRLPQADARCPRNDTVIKNSPNQKRFDPQLFLKSPQINNSHLPLIFSAFIRFNPRFLHCEVIADGACRSVRVPFFRLPTFKPLPIPSTIPWNLEPASTIPLSLFTDLRPFRPLRQRSPS